MQTHITGRVGRYQIRLFDDPLRSLTLLQKVINLILVAFHALMSTFMASGIIPAYENIAEDLGVTLQQTSYLTSIQNNIRARPISWEGAVRAKTITDEDLKKIKSIDKVRKEQRKQTIESDINSFVTLLLGGEGSQSIFEAAAKRQDIIHYMLVLLGDIIEGTRPSRSCHPSYTGLIPI